VRKIKKIFYHTGVSIIFFYFLINNTFAQFYNNGQDPACLKWKQINTEHYRILFPEDFLSKSQYLANLFEYTYSYENYSLQSNPRKITVIVHNQSVVSNGLVIWAPRRIELYPVPDPNSYPDDALDQLAFHELRHVVQMEKLNVGFSRALSYVVGDIAAGSMAIMVPQWYMEGDAITQETLLSRSGRGRLPSFEMGLRALTLEKGKVWDYDKSLMDSYKDYVPGKYEYGYQVVAYSRNKYGAELWDKALSQVANKPYTINPVNFCFRKQANLTKKRLYDSTFWYLRKEWDRKDKENEITPFRKLNIRKKKAFTSYRFPRYVNDSLVLVEKSGIDQINRFVLIDRKGNERVVHIPGYYEPVRLSVADGKIVWAETIYDERWYNRSFSDIKIYNIIEQKEYRLSRRARYFAPDISPDGKKIVAVRIETDNRNFIDILNISGKVLQSFSLPGNITFFKPTWKNNQSLLVIVLSKEGKSIEELNTLTGTWHVWVSPSFDDIQSVSASGRYIFFHATYSGIDNIYALDCRSKDIWQVTRSRFGASDVCVSPDEKKIVYNDYTSKGYNVAEIPVDPASWIPLDKIKDLSLHMFDSLLNQEKGLINQGSLPDSVYSVKSYSKFTHLLKVHSWLPFYFDYDNISLDNIPVYPGVVLYSQNYLSTLEGSQGYAYKDREHRLITSVTYRGLYPVFKFMEEYGGSPMVYQDSAATPLSDHLPPRSDFTMQVYVPLNLTINKYDRGLTPSVNFRFTNSYVWSDYLHKYNKNRIFLSYRLYYYNLLKMSQRDILPRLGFTLDTRFIHAPWDREDYGTITYFQGKLYLPGIMKHHTLSLQAGYEKQKLVRFYYLNHLHYPRGYHYWLSEKLKTFNAHYDFPVFYPDFSIGSLLYISRFSGSLFYEMAQGEKNLNYQNYEYSDLKSFQGCGGKLTVDFNVFRIEFPLSLGFWTAYNPDIDRVNTGFDFSINVYGLRINRQRRPLLPGSVAARLQ